MKKIFHPFILLVFPFLIFENMYAQCPLNIAFNTQSDIDDFIINYPSCTDITGDVTINDFSSPDITNLNGLSNINSIGGYLSINNSPLLVDLSGLDNLISIGDFLEIRDLSVTDLSDFPSLSSVDGIFRIRNNNSLSTISGFNNLTSIGSANGDGCRIENNSNLASITGLNILNTIFWDLTIRNNPLLSNISGFSSLSTCQQVRIEDSAISDLSGMSSLSSILSDFRIGNNDNLIDLSGLPSSLTSIGSLFVYDNDNLNTISCLPSGMTLSWDLSISNNNNLANLSGLPPSFSNIDVVTINGNDALINLSGLNVISSINQLTIIGNSSLNSLADIPNSIAGLSITNTNLTNLNSLPSSITSLNQLAINSNSLLTDLSGLNGITNLNNGSLRVQNNGTIVSLSGLENIDYNSISSLFLTINSNLTACELQNICDYIDSGNMVIIASNATGCNNVGEVQTACAVLPVELIAFSAKQNRDEVILNWQTASETNHAGFEIQRTRDFISWEKLDWKEGMGNSSNLTNYEYLDYAPNVGLNYYRLKQVDFDGGFEYSNIVSVDLSHKQFETKIFPNPTNNFLSISTNDERPFSVEIFDFMGRQILLDKTYNNEKIELNISTWSKGMYFIKVFGNGKEELHTFLKY